MATFSNLIGPIRIASSATAFFLARKVGYGRLVTIAVAKRIARFVASILPFKALMLIIIPGRTFNVLGHQLTAPVAAVIAIILAVLFFAAALFLDRHYDKRLSRLYGGQQRAGRNSLDTPPLLGEDVVLRRALKQSTDFVSGVVIAITILILSCILLPPSLFLLAPVIAIHLTVVAWGIGEGPSRFPLSEFNGAYGFCGAILTLVFLAALIHSGHPLGILTALFVFISTRQLLTSLSDVSRCLVSFSIPQTVKALEARMALVSELTDRAASSAQSVTANSSDKAPANSSDKAQIVSILPDAIRTPPPHLQKDQQRAWLQEVTSAVLGPAAIIESVVWRPMVGKSVHCVAFRATQDEEDRQLLVNVFLGRSAGDNARQERDFINAHPNNSQALTFIGTYEDAQSSCNVFEAEDCQDVSPVVFAEQVPALLTGLWSAPCLLASYSRASGRWIDLIDSATFELLMAIDTSDQHGALLLQLQQDCSRLQSFLRTLPLVYYNPDANFRTCMRHPSSGSLKCTLWYRAGYETIGTQVFDWQGVGLEHLDAVLRIAGQSRPEIGKLQSSDVRIAYFAYGLSRLIDYGALEVALQYAVSLASVWNERWPDDARPSQEMLPWHQGH